MPRHHLRHPRRISNVPRAIPRDHGVSVHGATLGIKFADHGGFGLAGPRCGDPDVAFQWILS